MPTWHLLSVTGEGASTPSWLAAAITAGATIAGAALGAFISYRGSIRGQHLSEKTHTLDYQRKQSDIIREIVVKLDIQMSHYPRDGHDPRKLYEIVCPIKYLLAPMTEFRDEIIDLIDQLPNITQPAQREWADRFSKIMRSYFSSGPLWP